MNYYKHKGKFRNIKKKKSGDMNKTEAKFYNNILLPDKADGKIVWIGYEKFKFRLADNTFYTPDFMALQADGEIVFHEIKGGYILDTTGTTKFKVVCELFPFIKFRMWQYKDKEFKIIMEN